MKILIIDLLNKSANGEEMPKKIKYKYQYWVYDLEYKDYTNIDGEWLFFNVALILNDKVEIIEDTPTENNKIKNLRSIDIGNNYNDNTDEYDIVTIDDYEVGVDDE